jgi:hypothetical protein
MLLAAIELFGGKHRVCKFFFETQNMFRSCFEVGQYKLTIVGYNLLACA